MRGPVARRAPPGELAAPVGRQRPAADRRAARGETRHDDHPADPCLLGRLQHVPAAGDVDVGKTGVVARSRQPGDVDDARRAGEGTPERAAVGDVAVDEVDAERLQMVRGARRPNQDARPRLGGAGRGAGGMGDVRADEARRARDDEHQ